MWGHAFTFWISYSLLLRTYLIHENLCSLNAAGEGLDVNLGELAGEEGVRDEATRGDVFAESGESSHAEVPSLKSGVCGEDAGVLADGKESIDTLVEKEISHGDVVANEELLGTEVLNEGSDGVHTLLDARLKLGLSESWSKDAHSKVGEDALEHDNLTALGSVSSHEGWVPSVADVDGDGLGLGELEVTILDVGNVGEGSTKVLLLGRPSVLWLTLEFPVLEVNSDVVEEMAVDVTTGASSDVPVSEDGSCLCHAYLDIFIFKDSVTRIT